MRRPKRRSKGRLRRDWRRSGPWCRVRKTIGRSNKGKIDKYLTKTTARDFIY